MLLLQLKLFLLHLLLLVVGVDTHQMDHHIWACCALLSVKKPCHLNFVHTTDSEPASTKHNLLPILCVWVPVIVEVRCLFERFVEMPPSSSSSSSGNTKYRWSSSWAGQANLIYIPPLFFFWLPHFPALLKTTTSQVRT